MQRLEHVHDEQERQLLEILSFLQHEYTKAAKPYIDRLVAIRQRRIKSENDDCDRAAARSFDQS